MRKILATLAIIFGLGSHSLSAQAQLNCTNAPDDEIIIEYFNVQSFLDTFEILINSTSSAYEVTLSCPERESSDIPPQDFDFTMRLSNAAGSKETSCADGSIEITKADLVGGNNSSCSGTACRFTLTLSNRSTGTLYSQTIVEIQLNTASQTIIPQLEPATLPICNNTINQCLVANTCTLNTHQTGILSLCESAKSCASPPNSQNYTYNDNIYFAVTIAAPGGQL